MICFALVQLLLLVVDLLNSNVQAASLQNPVNTSLAPLGLQLATNFTTMQKFQQGLAPSAVTQAQAIRDVYVASLVNGNNAINGYGYFNVTLAQALNVTSGNGAITGYTMSQTMFTATQTNPVSSSSYASASITFGGARSAFNGLVHPSLAFRVQNASLLAQRSIAGDQAGMLSAIKSVIPYMSFDDEVLPVGNGAVFSENDCIVANSFLRYQILFPVEIPVVGNSTYVAAVQGFTVTATMAYSVFRSTTQLCSASSVAGGTGPLGAVTQIINSGVTVNDGDILLVGFFCPFTFGWADSVNYYASYSGLLATFPSLTMDLTVTTTATAQTVPVQAVSVVAVPTAAPTVAATAAPTIGATTAPITAPTAATSAPSAVPTIPTVQQTTAAAAQAVANDTRGRIMSTIHLTPDAAKSFMGFMMAVFLIMFLALIGLICIRNNMAERYLYSESTNASKAIALITTRDTLNSNSVHSR
eukprot:TRINITY_DN1900_c0_g1_i1.p1 TRINITY_DN1900_c0_g1~~TRINITY_DN1900_c0_g1_i1.p1  ORF type:complete len:473 (+),score=81.81 TRINITY_DN1900_c0_g1_i1:71-1489(+)